VTAVLFVCSGNICRSPTAAALLAARADSRGDDISVVSAGTLDLAEPSPAEVVAAAADLGADVSTHVGHRFTPDEVVQADLIIGMAREHVREVVLAQPDVWPSAFTLRELVRRGHAVGRRGRLVSLDDWIARVHEGRRHTDLLGESDDDDVPDPMGGSPSEYRASAKQIAGLVDELVALAWPLQVTQQD
jgi:protein-tyrosine phosphatase